MRLDVRGEYPDDWREIADRVKAAAGQRCVRCLHPAERPGAPVPCDAKCQHPRNEKQRMLTVHHLDGDKTNCRWWNLLALCQVCHLSVQARVIPERPYLFQHSLWFVPYVAGFYAWYYGRLEITREEAERNPSLYIAMGQPWLAVEAV